MTTGDGESRGKSGTESAECRDQGPMFGDTECPDAERTVYSCTPGRGQEIVNHDSEARTVTNTEDRDVSELS